MTEGSVRVLTNRRGEFRERDHGGLRAALLETGVVVMLVGLYARVLPLWCGVLERSLRQVGWQTELERAYAFAKLMYSVGGYATVCSLSLRIDRLCRRMLIAGRVAVATAGLAASACLVAGLANLGWWQRSVVYGAEVC